MFAVCAWTQIAVTVAVVMHRENDANHVLVSTTTALHNALIRPCNLHSPLSLRINAIVDDHVAVVVVFAKLSVTRLTTVTDLLQVVPTRLIQAVRNKLLYELVIINLLTTCYVLSCRRYQTCWNNMLRVCWPRQPCYKMITTCSRLVSNWEQAVQTHLVDKL